MPKVNSKAAFDKAKAKIVEKVDELAAFIEQQYGPDMLYVISQRVNERIESHRQADLDEAFLSRQSR